MERLCVRSLIFLVTLHFVILFLFSGTVSAVSYEEFNGHCLGNDEKVSTQPTFLPLRDCVDVYPLLSGENYFETVSCEEYCSDLSILFEPSIDKKFFCEDGILLTPYADFGCCCTEEICEPPVIQNLTIEPDWSSLEKNNLTYNEVFPLEPFANLTISSESETSFLVNYTLSIKHPNSQEFIVLEEGQKTCGKNCQIPFPNEISLHEKQIEHDSLLKAEVQVYDSKACGNESGHSITHQYSPFFNLYPLRLEAINIIKTIDDSLISNRPIVVRNWIQLESYIKEYNESDGTTKTIPDYIDVVENLTVKLVLTDPDNKVEKTVIKDRLKKYIGISELKQNVEEVNSKADESMIKLREYKRAEESVNFIGVFPPKNTSTNIWFDLNINPGVYLTGLEESSYDDNKLKKHYDVMSTDQFKIMVDLVIFFEGKEKEIGVKSRLLLRNYTAERINFERAKEFILSIFPLDPTKVKTYIRRGIPSIKLDSDEMSDLIDLNIDSVDARDKAYTDLQRIADETGMNLIIGVVPSSTLNYGNVRGRLGESIPPDHDKTALVVEGSDPMVFAHEMGHLFTDAYRRYEQTKIIGCKDPNNEFGLLSSDGWCMKYDTGEDCDFAWSNFGGGNSENGANINIWTEPDEDGCYNEIDAPRGRTIQGVNPGAAGPRRPDIMSCSGITPWMAKFPTYTEIYNNIH